MKIWNNPERKEWYEITTRPSDDNPALAETVDAIFEQVRQQGDKALHALNRKYDDYDGALVIELDQLDRAGARISSESLAAIQLARQNIHKFHEAQLPKKIMVETMPGIECWREHVPIRDVGLYIPGGTAPLISTLLMLAIPAKIAKCAKISVFTPAGPNGEVDPAIRHVAAILGINQIHIIGGAQAIAAMGFGTGTISPVNKIFGPGNAYVNCAKMRIQQYGVPIDMPAGPSEVLIYADDSADPTFVAADLLSQAEHGADSQVILIASDRKIVDLVIAELLSQLQNLSRATVARDVIKKGHALVIPKIATVANFINSYAPEHLILNCANYSDFYSQVKNAGSIFVGPYSAEAIGDYASGTNHTLPTNGFARAYGGVTVESFMKTITYQRITEIGLRNVGPAVSVLAGLERLDAHQRAVEIRLEALKSLGS